MSIHSSTHERNFFMPLLSEYGVVRLTQKHHKIGLLLGMFMIKLRTEMWLKNFPAFLTHHYQHLDEISS
jgi:hypothetical protein